MNNEGESERVRKSGGANPLSIVDLAGVPVAALLGNWLGELVRAQVTDQPAHKWQMVHERDDGEKVIGLNLRLSTLLPALMGGFLLPPRSLFAFLSGFLAALLLGDQLEGPLWQLLDRQTVIHPEAEELL